MIRKLFKPHWEAAAGTPHQFSFRSAAFTDKGCVRSLNEDAYTMLPEKGLWAVADGMGGHQSGDVASALVVRRLNSITSAHSAYVLREAVIEELKTANEELRNEASGKGQGPIGATVVVLITHENHYSCIWAGDSRIYLIRGGRLHRLTKDHSYVQALVDAGEISSAEARSHAKAHVVTRAIGAGAELILETSHGEIRSGDRFLLCSDGLTGVLPDREIEKLAADVEIDTASQALMRAALSQGAPDNVTFILVQASTC